jgi:hypothetical protein
LPSAKRAASRLPLAGAAPPLRHPRHALFKRSRRHPACTGAESPQRRPLLRPRRGETEAAQIIAAAGARLFFALAAAKLKLRDAFGARRGSGRAGAERRGA